MKKDKVVLVYIPSIEKELHPGIYILKAYLQKFLPKINVDVVTQYIDVPNYSYRGSNFYPTFNAEEIRKIANSILVKNPHFVGFSAYIWNFDSIVKIANYLKKIRPMLPIILGGAEPTNNADEIINKYKSIDIVVIDEGEETFVDLVKALILHQKELREISGIYYKDKNKIVKNSLRKPLDLATVPSPYLTGVIKINKPKKFEATIETSRGCPFKCAYCSYNLNSMAKLRFFPIENAKEELSYLLKKGIREIKVLDDNFNIHEPRALELLKLISKYNKMTEIKIFLRIDIWLISEKLTRLLSSPYITIIVGIQSLNPVTLNNSKRLANREVLEKNLTLLRKYNVNIIFTFIIGLPGDRYSDVMEAIDWSFVHRPTGTLLQTLRINSGALFKKDAKKFGLRYYRHLPYEIYRSTYMSARDLKRANRITTVFTYLYRTPYYQEILFNLMEGKPFGVTSLLERLEKNIPLNMANFSRYSKQKAVKTIMKALDETITWSHPQNRTT